MDLKQATKNLHEALDTVINAAVAHGQHNAEETLAARLKGLLGTNGATAPSSPAVASATEPKRKFRKTKAWREAVKRNLAKGRGPRKSALKTKGKFKRKGRK